MIQNIKELLPSVFLAVVIATAFFIHEGFSLMPEKYNQAKAGWQSAKTGSAKVLNEIKQLNIDLFQGNITSDEFSERQPSLIQAYIQISQERKELHKIALDAQSEAKFLGFDSFQYFLGELGWAFGLFLYALANLLNTYYLQNRYMKREFAGKILLHGTLLFIGCFYTVYVFYSKKDFNAGWYFASMVLCTLTLIFACKFIMDTYTRRTEYLMENINRLIAFIFRIRNKHYRKLALKVLYSEKQNVILDEDDTLESNHNEFEQDFYNTVFKTRT